MRFLRHLIFGIIDAFLAWLERQASSRQVARELPTELEVMEMIRSVRAAEIAAYNDQLKVMLAHMLEVRTSVLVDGQPVPGDYCVWVAQRNTDQRSN